MMIASLVFIASCEDRNGLVGAKFHLRDDSPLPSWIVLPHGTSRDQINITITRYEATTTPKWKVRFLVQDKAGKTIRDEIAYGYWHPDSEREKAPAATYPNWVIIEANGTKEVYEQSGPNNLLRIVKKPPIS